MNATRFLLEELPGFSTPEVTPEPEPATEVEEINEGEGTESVEDNTKNQ